MEEKGFVDSRQEERVAGHERAAAPPLSRDPLRPESPWRVRDAARRTGPQADGGAMSFESRVIAFCRSLPVGAHLRADRRAGAGRPAVRRRGGTAQPRWPTALAVLRAVAGGARPRCRGATPAALLQADAAVGLLLHVPAGASASGSSRPGPSSSSRSRWCSRCRSVPVMVCFWPSGAPARADRLSAPCPTCARIGCRSISPASAS